MKTIDYLQTPSKMQGVMDDAVRFVLENQLKDRETWKKYTEVFSTHEDTQAGRWRGEYFGKQMRGAALTYRYTQDEELYEILTETVVDLLARQDAYGRFSTYAVENEFHGWDMWCRKYVLVGLLSYHAICRDEALQSAILSACCKHMDYIVQKVGDGEGQIPITQTSHWWGCVNSCTILEPTLELYKRTGKAAYLAFAKYILSTGGCSDCNLIELANDGALSPYQYPVVKAYEMMSFYEGLVAYYEVTGETYYLHTAQKFIEAVANTDITIIGCAGCTHELFDHSAIKQTEYQENIMQETCVTVTWMRLLARVYAHTGDKKYIDRLEISGYNALYGSLNTERNEQLEMERGIYQEARAFDSYSPLYMNTRWRGIGGFNTFASGGYGGCCIVIGAAAVALMPLLAVMQGEQGIYLNLLFFGSADVVDLDGKKVTLRLESGYPATGKAFLKIECENVCRLKLHIRIPAWCTAKQFAADAVEENGYAVVEGTYRNGTRFGWELGMRVQEWRLNGKVAYTYGALTLAADEEKCSRPLRAPVWTDEALEYRLLPCQKGELVRLLLRLGNGEELLLTDYQSCGKKAGVVTTAWFNEKQ